MTMSESGQHLAVTRKVTALLRATDGTDAWEVEFTIDPQHGLTIRVEEVGGQEITIQADRRITQQLHELLGLAVAVLT